LEGGGGLGRGRRQREAYLGIYAGECPPCSKNIGDGPIKGILL